MNTERTPACPARRWLMPVLALAVLAVVLLVGSHSASAAEIDVDAPAESKVGEVVEVRATVTADGEPVADAVVAVTRQARLGGSSGFVALDSGVTDADGVVDLEFVQYADSTDVASMRVEYEGPDGVEAAEFELTVLPGPQQYSSSSGADVGPINRWWLIVVLAIVWLLLLVAAWQIVAISRAREGARLHHHAMPYYMVGFVAFTAAGMFYVVLTQPTMHANLAVAESFDRAQTAYVGREEAYLGMASLHSTRPDDVSGEELYIVSGCASCHGIGGAGAIIGGELTASMMSDDEDVFDAIRRGPKGMPVYSDQTLPDDEVDRIIEYLIALGD